MALLVAPRGAAKVLMWWQWQVSGRQRGQGEDREGGREGGTGRRVVHLEYL